MSDVPTEPEVDDPDATDDAELDEPAGVEPEVDPDEADEVDEDEVEAETQASSTAILKALEREETRHRKAVAKALGVDEGELHDCPTCQAMGYTPDPIEAEVELAQDPYLETCDRCRGNGEVKTGATAAALWKVPCSGCGGSGYVTKAEQPQVGAVLPNGDHAGTYAPPTSIGAPAELDDVQRLRDRGYVVVEPPAAPAPAGT